MRSIVIGLVCISSVAVAAPAKSKAPKRPAAAESPPSAELVYNSARICVDLDIKKTSEAAIAKEKRYAKRYGVVNLEEIDTHKQRIMDADRDLGDARQELKSISKPLPCGDDLVKTLLDCIGDFAVEIPLPDQNRGVVGGCVDKLGSTGGKAAD